MFLLVFMLLFMLFKNVSLELDKINNILNLLISTISITIAILVTFFFSKLFAEKQERIQRKVRIDEYSEKLTAFRRIAFHLRSNDKIWNVVPKMKSTLDNKYKYLTLEDFMQKYVDLTDELGAEAAPMAYLGLRGLENNESTFDFYKLFKIQNYSLKEIISFKDYSNKVWYFFENNKEVLSFTETSTLHLNPIKENYFIITKRQTNNDLLSKDLIELFDAFSEKFFHEYSYLTYLNTRKLPQHFTWISINFVLYVVMIIASIIIYTLDFSIASKSNLVIIILSVFISSTIDLTIGLFLSLRRELDINEFNV